MSLPNLGFLVLCLHICSCFITNTNYLDTSSPKPILQHLYEKVEESQVKEVDSFPFLKLKGTFGSQVKINFNGDPAFAWFRDRFQVYDNNGFSTTWVLNCLLEAHMYGNFPAPSKELVLAAVRSLDQFRDHNAEYATSIMTFWRQTLNTTNGVWESYPENLLRVFKLADCVPWYLVGDILTTLGFGEFWHELSFLIENREELLKAFRIPPDFDDTFLNIGLGGLLTNQRTNFPDSFQMWQQRNSNLSSVINALKEFAYRPFGLNNNTNAIDPRTYFAYRKYLQASRQTGSLALIPTWVQDIQTDRLWFKKGVAMPYNINNVDVVVCANSIYGLTSAFLNKLSMGDTIISDPDLHQIYSNSSHLISWVIGNNITSRPDLAMTYYPSRFNFYWFTARTLFLLENKRREPTSLPVVLEQTYSLFSEALRVAATKDVLSRGKSPEQNVVFFDDFLGNGDTNWEGHPDSKHEDRLFTTAAACNMLIATWTFQDNKTRKLYWINETPESVKVAVKSASGWLANNILKDELQPWNAFFSGSGKSPQTQPFFFPANLYEYLNGTVPHENITISAELIIGMQGLMSEYNYNEELLKPHFGTKTEVDFHGYNGKGIFFPFWSSEPFTYATVLLAIAQSDNISAA